MAEKDYLTSKERDGISLRLYLGRQDYGWEPYKEVKHFVLTNPGRLSNFDVDTLTMNFAGTGHSEWEMLLAMWLLQAARKSLEEKTECDVSKVFNVELLARPIKKGEDYRRLTPKQIRSHLSRFFDVVSEDDNICVLTLH